MESTDKKNKRRKMPSAPIKAPGGNVKGIGKVGWFTGGMTPGVVAPVSGNSNPMQLFMRGYSSARKRGK